MDQAKARKRADAYIEKTRREFGDAAAEHAARVMESTLEVMAARPNDEPPAPIADAVSALENIDREAERIISRWFDAAQHRGQRALYFLEPADAMLRALATGAFRDFSFGFNVEPTALVAIATTRRDTWRLSEATTLEVVAELIAEDVACDLDLFKNTELGSCMEGHARILDSIAKCDENSVGTDGLPDPMRREYIGQRFHTVPFARGNVIVLARICDQCFNAFIYGNHIATNQIGIVEPMADGFGSVGAGPIPRSEYLWDRSVIAETADDFENCSGRRPNLDELQKALHGVAFIGAGSHAAQELA